MKHTSNTNTNTSFIYFLIANSMKIKVINDSRMNDRDIIHTRTS